MIVWGVSVSYYTGKLGFELIEDTALSAGKRWVLVAPRGDGGTRLLLAKATEVAINDGGIIPLHYQVNTWGTRKGLKYVARTDERTVAMMVEPAE